MAILFIGEAMVELRRDSNGGLLNAYAGDVLNAAIYAKRLNTDLQVGFLSVVGRDLFSTEFLDSLEEEGIDRTLVMRDTERNMGIYSIQTDAQGEREFFYWRGESAARCLDQYLTQSVCQAMCSYHYIVFSGISLAILSQAGRRRLLDVIASCRASGVKIAFDPNYRAVLWESLAEARHSIASAYEVSDIVFPGLDDHFELWGHSSEDEVFSYFNQLQLQEIILKAGEQGVVAVSKASRCHRPLIAAPVQLDSTAAGDSFAGSYLASRASGLAIADSVDNAMCVSREVVQHKGAIIDKKAYARVPLIR